MKIALVTTGQPSTNPRLVKEANALVEAGHEVKVYYLFWSKWATETDKPLLKEVKWEYQLIGGSPYGQKTIFTLNKLKSKLLQQITKNIDFCLEAHRCNAYDQLLATLKKNKADHYIGHNLGALAPVAKAAKFHNVSYSFDAEDFHRGQYQIACRAQEIDIILENKYFKDAKFITTASPLITRHYQSIYPEKEFITINNVFPQSEFNDKISINESNPLKLVWFSQTIGENRGLENIIVALNHIDSYTIELHLYGNHHQQTREYFTNSLTETKHKIYFYKPIPSKKLNYKISEFDVGIASETSRDTNNDIALSNKILSYIQAGLAILASDTKAQKLLMAEYSNIGFSYSNQNPLEVVELLNKWNDNRDLLKTHKLNAKAIAKNHLNWEKEKNKFITLFDTP